MNPPGDGAASPARPARGRSKTIVLVTHSHYPDDPRATKHATALHEAGFDVIVLALRRRGDARVERIAGVLVERLPLRHKRGDGARYAFEYAAILALAGWRLAQLAVARRPVAVQINNPPDLLVFAALVPKLLGARVVLDMHEPMPELFASIRGAAPGAASMRFLRWAERTATRFADRVITVSEVCRSTFAARGTPAAKITVVHNVSDMALSGVERVRDAAPRPFTIVYHGTLVARYGVDIAIRALARVRRDVPGARLEIYGRGEEMDALGALARELGLADAVHFGGQVALAAIPERLARADVGVVPNRSDVFMDLVLPTKLFEYVALRVPAAVARTAAVAAHFGGDDLYYFEPGDVDGLAHALLDVHARPDEARARAARLSARFAGRTWDSEKRTLVALYRELAGGAPAEAHA
jgi:glycosyltransferase involved in cell wall biosynthesis